MKRKSYVQFAGTIMMIMALFSNTFVTAAPPTHVHAHVIAPKSETEELAIDVHAPAEDTFTLKIYDLAGVLSQEVTVNGGTNTLPSLPEGSYTFELFNIADEVVENGKFKVSFPAPKPPKPDTLVTHPKPPKPDTSVVKPPKPDTLVANPPKPEPDSNHVHAHVKGTRLGDVLILHVHADSTENFVLTVFDSAGAVIQTLPVTGGENILPALPLGSYTFSLTDSDGVEVETGKFKIKPEHVHAHVKGKHYGDTLTLHVHADSTEVFTLTIYDEAESVLHTLTVHGGENLLPSLAIGKYSFTLVDEDGNQVEEGKFSVKVRPVHTGIHPNPSDPGDGTIFVDAPATDSFLLQIYDSSLVVLHSENIPGGTTLLPALPSGIYYYKVLNSDGYEVSKGRILIY